MGPEYVLALRQSRVLYQPRPRFWHQAVEGKDAPPISSRTLSNSWNKSRYHERVEGDCALVPIEQGVRVRYVSLAKASVALQPRTYAEKSSQANESSFAKKGARLEPKTVGTETAR